MISWSLATINSTTGCITQAAGSPFTDGHDGILRSGCAMASAAILKIVKVIVLALAFNRGGSILQTILSRRRAE